MKQNEVALFEVERLFFTDKKDRKLESRIYFLMELQSWITIIDIYGDRRFYKVILNEGKGIHRLDGGDDLDCDVKAMNCNFEILQSLSFRDKKFTQFSEELNLLL